MLPAAILVGGLATRLRPITKTIPKALVEVAGEPFIVHQLRNLACQGLNELVLCTGYLGHQIEDFVRDGSDYGVRIRYSREKNQLLGTGGAIRNALPLLGEAFFVLYGDSFLEIDYQDVQEAFCRSGSPALMTVFQNEGKWDTSNVEIEKGCIKLYSKKQLNHRMTHIDYGLGILKKDVFKKYPLAMEFDLAEVYENLSQTGRLAMFETDHRFYEIGSLAGLGELNLLMQRKKEQK